MFNVLIVFDNIINYLPLLGNSYVVGSIQTERSTELSGLESGINIVIRSTTLVSSNLFDLKPTVMRLCIHANMYTQALLAVRARAIFS